MACDHISDNGEANKKMKQTANRTEPIFVVNCSLDLLLVAITLIAFVTRLWRLEDPRGVVFDEIHFGRFAGLYLQGVFFFDVHPPLGRLLITLMGYLSGFDGNFDFSIIGTEYPCSFPIWHLRLIPAVCGSLLCPLAYLILSELGFHQYSACLAAFLVLTDNALLTQSRFILIDSMLLLSLLAMIYSLLKFLKYFKRPFSLYGSAWATVLSLSITASLSVKYSGLFSVLLVSLVLLFYSWRMIIDKTIPLIQVAVRLLGYALFFVVLPVVLYCLIFWLHLSLLWKSGTHDEMMSSSFQATLEGGLARITEGQPRRIAYSSQITLRHTHGTPCWLHSHSDPYPVRYSDNRGSSAQQQVTCYSYKDINNWWIVVEQDADSIDLNSPPKPVKDGDIIKLIHGVTGRSLNSHDVAAPMSPQCMEVSCYVDYNISFPAQPLWRVELLNGAKTNQTWQAMSSHIRLIHVTTNQALKFTGNQLPDWGFYQYEVATDRIHQQEATVWNVEEHRLSAAATSQDHQLPPDIWSPGNLGFWEKFLEVQMKMLWANSDVNQEHQYSSSALEWPTMNRGVAYWISPDSNAQIHFLGNPVTWVSGLVAAVLFFLMFVTLAVRWRRQCQDLTPDEWTRLILSAVLLVGGWVFNLVPYMLMERTLFLHHYLPGLLHLLILLPVTVEMMYRYVLFRSSIQRNVMTAVLLVWLTSVFLAFVRLLPLSYGHTSLTEEDIKSLQWRESWGFIYREEFK
ncbi:protein O-mannosyl-transferase 1-like isoform X2 [Apostichopus japonicus]